MPVPLIELRRAAAALEVIDAFSGDLLCVGVLTDERPLRGAAGLVDWRTGTWLTEALRRGWLTGATGEALLFPPGRRLGARAVVAIGLGASGGFGEDRLAAAAAHVARVAAGLGARDLCIEAPGPKSAGAGPGVEVAEAALRGALEAALPGGAQVLLLV